MTSAREVGAALARRHETSVEPDPERSLLRYAESSRTGDWTLRSAVVRLAQPHPELASQILEAVRRCDGALHGVARALLAHGTWTDPALHVVDDLQAEQPPRGDDRGAPLVADARVTDLARLARGDPDRFDELLAGYETEHPLTGEELASLPLLEVALDLSELAEVLAAWAATGHEAPPVAVATEVTRRANERLDELGVAREVGPARP